MDLSIVIVNWNTKKFVLDAIESIIKSTPKVSYEIVVVDNASSDGSVDALNRLSKEHSHVVVLPQKTNLGFATGTNVGIKRSKGKNILLLNSDTKVKKGALESLVDFANKTKYLGAVAPKLLNADGSTQESVFRFPSISLAIRQYYLKSGNFLDKYAPPTKEATKVDICVMAAFLVPQKVIQDVGLLDEGYKMYFEDFDYCQRLKRAGLDVYYLPTAEVYHYHGQSGKELVESENQWRRLIPGSKRFHGSFKHYIINFIIWSGQKFWKKQASTSKR